MALGTSDGKYFEDEWTYVTESFNPKTAQKPQQSLDSLFEEQASSSNRMPLGAPGEVTDAFKSDSGTQVAGDFGEIQNRSFVDKLKETWPVKMIEGIVDAAKLPGDVYSGKVDLNSQEGMDRVTNMAMNLAGGGLSTTPLKPGVGLFGGRMSKAAVDTAAKMEKEGFSEVTVKEMTGLERGADKMWRKEFSDVGSQFSSRNFVKAEEGVSHAFLGDVFKHDELYKIYPEARDIPVMKVNEIPGSKTASGGYSKDIGAILIRRGMDDTEARSIILHEIQHWIQDKEGFAMGSTVLNKLPTDLKEAYKKILLEKEPNHPLTPDYRLYKAVAGEQEAFNVQARQILTPKDIKQTLGKSTETVPRQEQIIGR